MNRTTPDTATRDAIEACVRLYVQGAKEPGTDTLREAFREGATIYGYFDGELLEGPIDLFYEWHTANGPATDVESRILLIDHAETIATIRVELDNWTGHDFSDILSLIREDGRWVIVNKLFHVRA
ncbi:MAG: nuclear transport factor 2 family protein [Phycisphaerales bacterium]